MSRVVRVKRREGEFITVRGTTWIKSQRQERPRCVKGTINYTCVNKRPGANGHERKSQRGDQG